MLSLSFHSSTAPDCMQLLFRGKLKGLLQAVELCSMLLSHVTFTRVLCSIHYGGLEKIDIVYFDNAADNCRHILLTRLRHLTFQMGRIE